MKKNGRKQSQKTLTSNLSCYVLITCEEASEDGQMPVKMTYQGDESLVSYLLQGAQNHIDQVEESLEFGYVDPPIRLVK